MSYEPSYGTRVLSTINIGGNDYTLKDATLLAIIQGMNPSITEAALLTAISGESADAAKLVTNAGIKNYVDSAVAAIHNFDVAVYTTLPTAGPSTMYILGLVEDSSAIGTYIEYITVRSGEEGSYTYAWEQIGSTQISLADYIKTSEAQAFSVAGVSFGSDGAITVGELEASTALNLKALAHKAEASGTTASQTVSGITATGTPEGDVSVTLKDATSASNAGITPKDIEVSTTLSNGKTTAAGTVAIAAGTSSDYQVTGSVSQPDITVTPTSTSIYEVTSVGTAASFTQGAKASWSASVNGETLSFNWSANGDDSFTPNTPASLASEATSVLTGATAALANAPTFTGGYVKATFSGSEAAVTGDVQQTLTNAGVSAVTYYKQEVSSATFSGSAATFDVADIVVPAQNITVS